MPTDTFKNLKSKKKDLIIAAIIKELSLHTYEHISIANIIRDANISRGSFYQYFDDKLDLFMYMVEYIGTLKQSLFHHIFMSEDLTFIERIKQLFLTGITFKKTYPELVLVGKKMIESEQYRRMLTQGGLNLKVIKIYQDWIIKDQNKGLVRKDLNTLILAEISHEITSKLSIDSFIYETYEESLWATKVNEVLDIIQKGIVNHV